MTPRATRGLRFVVSCCTAAIVLATGGRWEPVTAEVVNHHAHSTADVPRQEVAGPSRGRMVYNMACIYCHGARGRGDGPASAFIGPYSHPRPNDFTAGIFKFRSTESGELPTLKDLTRTIRDGIPGVMPSFRNLGEASIRAVADFIATEFIRAPLPTESGILYVEHVGPYTYSVDSVRRGSQLYEDLKCGECHGTGGVPADTPMHDERGLAISPMDLRHPGMFGNGSRHEDIYRTIMTGLDGTPMPGYSQLFKGDEQKAWDLVHYILSLQSQ